jgi:hypothetical protein
MRRWSNVKLGHECAVRLMRWSILATRLVDVNFGIWRADARFDTVRPLIAPDEPRDVSCRCLFGVCGSVRPWMRVVVGNLLRRAISP